MATLPPLLTTTEFSAGTKGKVSADDPRLPQLIEGASTAIRRYCGWHVTPVVEETITLDGAGGSLLLLPTLNVEDITSVTVNGTALDVAELEWSQKGMVRRNCWPHKFRSIVVTYRHGFETAPDLMQIAQQVVANAISSPLGATSEQAGALSVSWATTAPGVSGGLSLLQRDYAVLDQYKLPKAA